VAQRRRSGPLRTSGAASGHSVDIAGGGARNVGDGQETGMGAPMPPISGPECSLIGSTSEIYRAKNEFRIGRHALSLP